MDQTEQKNPEKNGFFKLSHPSGQEVTLTPQGASWVSWVAPEGEKNDRKVDILLGYDSPTSYGRCPAYLGASIGRYANRIARGMVEYHDGDQGHPIKVTLAQNDGFNHLHGGPLGLHQKLWRVLEWSPHVVGDKPARLKMDVESHDGEGGYPGNLRVELEIELNALGFLSFTYQATTDKKTFINLTHHPYFNLAGVFPREDQSQSQGRKLLGDALRDHQVMIDADMMTEIDEFAIPTGFLKAVAGSPFDFRELRSPADSINAEDPQLLRGKGYDHFFVLRQPMRPLTPWNMSERPQAMLRHAPTGRLLEMWTQQVGLQFYTGNWLDGKICGKGGCHYTKRSGICLEPQNFPDAPNKSMFLSPFYNKGDIYENKVIYRLSNSAKNK